MKKVLLFTLCLVLLGATAAMATTINFSGDIAYGSDGNPYTNPTVIGETNWFYTSQATFTNGMLTIYTNWNPGKDGTYGPGGIYSPVKTADLFIKIGASSNWNYAIDLDYHSTSQVNATVYQNPTITYSNDSTFNFASVGIYGEHYINTSTLVPVKGTSSTTSTTHVTWSSIDPLATGNTVIVDLNGILTPSSEWGFVWGTTTCANGTVYGEVPICSSVLLLGTGLVGLAGLRRRKGRAG